MKKQSIRKLNREARKFGFDSWAQYTAAIAQDPRLMENLMAIAAKSFANTEEQRRRKGLA